MRQILGREMWIGHVGDTRNPSSLVDAGIRAVIELADSEPPAALPRELLRCRFPLSDGGDNPSWLLRLVVETIASLLRAGVPTLICCGCGMSRSVCLASYGLALAESLQLQEAMVIVAGAGPADVSPRLFAQVQAALAQK